MDLRCLRPNYSQFACDAHGWNHLDDAFPLKGASRIFFARIAVVALFMTVTVAFGDYLREKSNSVALFIIVAAEYFEDRRCRNLEAEDLVAHLSEDNISIFSHRLNAFRFDICRN